jgi:NAD(P)-dependent dehydrogenase (short-subunit alcohol dehydrogenase family)
MSQRLQGRRAVVTGAASGIGAATARRLAREGAAVLAVDLHPFEAGGLPTLAQDVSAPGAAGAIMAEAARVLGGLDILVNNAGICLVAGIEDHPDDVWARTMAINVDAVFRLSRAAVPLLKTSAAGRIINIGSIMSDFGAAGMVAYGTSKHAVLGLTRSLASDLGPHGITVNAIQPGAIETGITKPNFEADPSFKAFWEAKSSLKRIGQPDDIAALAAFLASDDAAFMSGHGIYCDGGAMQNP